MDRPAMSSGTKSTVTTIWAPTTIHQTSAPLHTTPTSAVKAQSPKPVLQQSLFFTKLNLDVRIMIYDHLYGQLPPLAHQGERYHKPGMIMSCKQANLVSRWTRVKIYVLGQLTGVSNSHKPLHGISSAALTTSV
jgi:hypothetical protein